MTIDEMVKQSKYHWDWLVEADTEGADVWEKHYVNADELIWENGIWNDGRFLEGIWKDGIFKGGEFNAVTAQGEVGSFEGGRFEGGLLIINSIFNWNGGQFIDGEVKISTAGSSNYDLQGGYYKFTRETITMNPMDRYKSRFSDFDMIEHSPETWDRLFAGSITNGSYSDEFMTIVKALGEKYEVWGENKVLEEGMEKFKEKYDLARDFRDRFFDRVEEMKEE